MMIINPMSFRATRNPLKNIIKENKNKTLYPNDNNKSNVIPRYEESIRAYSQRKQKHNPIHKSPIEPP